MTDTRTVPPEPADDLAAGSGPITVPGDDELTRRVMQMRDCSWPDAEAYIESVGREQAARDIRTYRLS